MHITLLGTGLLGAAVSERLLAQGHTLSVWNRNPAKTTPLHEQGAQCAATPAAALQASDITLLFLADRAAIESALLNASTRDALRGRLIVNMGTISPADSLTLAQAFAAAGANYAECPVLGSQPEARSGTLILMFGGTEAQFSSLLPLLRDLGGEPRHIGVVGQAAALKLAMNQLIASETAAFAMSLALVQAHGVAVDDFMQLLRGSALYAPTFDKKLERMLSGDFSNPNFPLNHLIKDVRLFIDSAKVQHINTQALVALEATLFQVAQSGHGLDDYSALQRGFIPHSPNDA